MNGIEITNAIRQHGIACDQYPEVVKCKKSMKYANDIKSTQCHPSRRGRN